MGQIVLPDRSVLIGQKSVENAKIKKIICDILSNFQTMCRHRQVIVPVFFQSKHCNSLFCLGALLEAKVDLMLFVHGSNP